MVEELGADGGEHAAQRPVRVLQEQRIGPGWLRLKFLSIGAYRNS